MMKSNFTETQIAFILRQAEEEIIGVQQEVIEVTVHIREPIAPLRLAHKCASMRA